MKRINLSILIYNLEVFDRRTETIENHYFLFYRRAKKFWDSHREEFERMNCDVSLGGEQLWLL